MNNEDKLARIQAWEVEAKEHIKEIEAPGITALNAHRILELISDLREAWAEQNYLGAELVEKTEALKNVLNFYEENVLKFYEGEETNLALARRVLARWDRTTKEAG